MKPHVSETRADDQSVSLADVLNELRAIRQLLEARPPGLSKLSRADQEVLGRLLPAMAGSVGSDLFLASEVIDMPGLRPVLADLNTRSLGRLLRRAAGHPIDGFVVDRVDAEAGAVIWQIRGVPEFPVERNCFVPCAPRDEAPK